MSIGGLQIQREAPGSVTAVGNVIFDKVVYSSPGVAYNPETGVITLQTEGRYIVDWWIATQCTTIPDGVIFRLVTSEGNYVEGNSPLKEGVVTGNGIFYVNEPPMFIRLVSQGTVYFSHKLPVKANLVVMPDATAPTGPAGTMFATHFAGDIGTANPVATESVTLIPFASGAPVRISTGTAETQGSIAMIAFGNSAAFTGPAGTIDLTNADNFAFSVSSDATIVSIAGYFSIRSAEMLAHSAVTITAQLFSSQTPDDIFAPVPNALVKLSPSLAGRITSGTMFNGITADLKILITAQTRLLLVFFAEATDDADGPMEIVGYASAGLTINAGGHSPV